MGPPRELLEQLAIPGSSDFASQLSQRRQHNRNLLISFFEESIEELARPMI
jgi:hypothetical protein